MNNGLLINRYSSVHYGLKGYGRIKQDAFKRGGNWNNGTNAGAFTLNLNNAPGNSNDNIGFRCVRFSGFIPQPEFPFPFLRQWEASTKTPGTIPSSNGKYQARFPGQLKSFHQLGVRGLKNKNYDKK